jgi:hypothetical protein
MAHESVEYKGHTIEAETHPAENGFTWSYTIDGNNFRESRDRPLKSEEIILREAIDSAKRHVDAMSVA